MFGWLGIKNDMANFLSPYKRAFIKLMEIVEVVRLEQTYWYSGWVDYLNGAKIDIKYETPCIK